jgi:hypothetical protein
LKDAPNILGGLEKLPVLRMLLEIEIRDIPVACPAELFESPCFTDLPHPVENQRLAVSGFFPTLELNEDSALHDVAPFGGFLKHGSVRGAQCQLLSREY